MRGPYDQGRLFTHLSLQACQLPVFYSTTKLLDKPDGKQSNGEKQGRLKSFPCTYEPDLRTSGWLKLKKDYMEGMGDSMDLIPVGAWHGNGRKAHWWSPVLLALWNPETGRPVAVCKCMSGAL